MEGEYIEQFIYKQELRDNSIDKNDNIIEPVLGMLKKYVKNEIKEKYDLEEIKCDIKYKILHKEKMNEMFTPVELSCDIYKKENNNCG